MSAVTIDEAWPGFGSAFTVAELDRTGCVRRICALSPSQLSSSTRGPSSTLIWWWSRWTRSATVNESPKPGHASSIVTAIMLPPSVHGVHSASRH